MEIGRKSETKHNFLWLIESSFGVNVANGTCNYMVSELMFPNGERGRA